VLVELVSVPVITVGPLVEVSVSIVVSELEAADVSVVVSVEVIVVSVGKDVVSVSVTGWALRVI
jgi:hypothetical protein